MQDVVPAVGQEVTCEPVQFTLLPLFVLVVPAVKDAGEVPKREMMNPWQ